MKLWKKISIGLLIIFLGIIFVFHDLINYTWMQASGQLKIITESVKVEKVLSDTSFDDETKRKLRLIQKVRTFAFDELGLKKNKNYTSFYNQNGKEILWNVSASKPFELSPYKWKFPFLGSFPYKGFFNKAKALEELEKLNSKGFDTNLRSVSGWSTLGWFNDPILSNMLNQSDGRIAELIIHELTHGTIFIKDDIIFNENLASFVGENGAILFLKNEYGENSSELFEYQLQEEDSKTFTKQMLLATKFLKKNYAKHQGESDSSKSIHKHIVVDEIITSFDTLHFHNNFYYDYFEKNRPNNANFLSYTRYHSSEDSLKKLLSNHYQNDLKHMIKAFSSKFQDKLQLF